MTELGKTNSYQIVGHRGFKTHYPENTLLAFKEALNMDIDVIEFDLRFSKDKEIVVIHDEDLDRTTNGKGYVGNYTLKELKQLDAGGWLHSSFEGLKIPTLDELCQLLVCYPEILLNVEIKKDQYAIEVADRSIELLDTYGLLSKCIFTSFDADIIAHIKDKYQLRTQGFPAEKMFNFVHGEQGTYSKMDSIGLSRDLLTPELVSQWQGRGIIVSGYVLDKAPQIYHAISCGVKLITCDNPVDAIEFRKWLEHNG